MQTSPEGPKEFELKEERISELENILKNRTEEQREKKNEEKINTASETCGMPSSVPTHT